MVELDKTKTCFENCRLLSMKCKNTGCRSWIENDSVNNCVIIAVDENQGNVTLQDVGDIFDLTRMRICQIEQSAIKKIKKKADS